MKTIGILGAMPEEIKLLAAMLEDPSTQQKGGVTFHLGRLFDKKAVLCCAGMGKVNAAAATQLLITAYGADAIICNGIAGNFSSEIGVGDVVIGQSAVYHDAELAMIAQSYPGLREYPAAEVLIAAACEACREEGVRFITGRIATGDQFIADPVKKADIAARCAPACVEMEGAAVAHIAAKNDVPFVIIRTMSDECDEQAAQKLVVEQFDVTAYCRTAADIVAGAVRRL